MPRRKQSRPSPSQKGQGQNNRFANRHSHANPATPTNGRRGKAQRLLLLGNDFDLDRFAGSGHSSGRHKFTLQQEARNTEEWSFRRNDDRKLRTLGIKFVRPQQTDGSINETSTNTPPLPPKQHAKTLHTTPPISKTTPTESELSTIYTSLPRASGSPRSGSSSKKDGHQKPPNESSSSEEEVVFVPRNQRRPNGSQPNPEDCKAQSPVPSEKAGSPSIKPKVPKKTPRRHRHPGFRATDEEDEILADYIQNLEENGEDIEDVFSLRPLGNHLDDINTRDEDALQLPDESELEAVEPDIYVDINVAAVIGKRNGQYGSEYQFKPAGSTVEEALWLEGTDMTRDIQHLIDHFEAELDDIGDVNSGPEGSEVQISGEEEDIDRRLAKIFGFGEDDEDDNEYDDDEDEEFDADDLLNMMLGKPNKQGVFPRASKLADAYDDFDIMSRERSSLSRPSNRKSRKANIGRSPQGILNMEMGEEEAELHAELENYILQDREKKKIRKQEREARRQAGMLGSSSASTKSASMDIKGYSAGMSLSKVHVSIKQFLMSGVAERLSLPPMSKQERVQIHILANKFFMVSKSQGKGNSRFPVLYKTKRSQLFDGDEVAIDDVLSSLGGRDSQGRLGGAHNKTGRKLARSISGGNINAEGMIVGTGATELGHGNKGFHMLSKMGWTTGTGLGSSRSGILDPVQAIVKNSRAGLG